MKRGALFIGFIGGSIGSLRQPEAAYSPSIIMRMASVYTRSDG